MITLAIILLGFILVGMAIVLAELIKISAVIFWPVLLDILVVSCIVLWIYNKHKNDKNDLTK